MILFHLMFYKYTDFQVTFAFTKCKRIIPPQSSIFLTFLMQWKSLLCVLLTRMLGVFFRLIPLDSAVLLLKNICF